MKKTRITFLAVLVTGFLGASSVWFYLTCRGVCFVRMADYRVSVPGKPGAAGVIYSLGDENYLLVLADRSSGHHEAYYVKLDHREIGLPNFNPSKYEPYSHGALVDKLVLEGYPYIGTLAADWRVTEQEVIIRITGRPPGVQKADFIDNPEEFYRTRMPVAYEAEVVLTKTPHVR